MTRKLTPRELEKRALKKHREERERLARMVKARKDVDHYWSRMILWQIAPRWLIESLRPDWSEEKVRRDTYYERNRERILTQIHIKRAALRLARVTT